MIVTCEQAAGESEAGQGRAAGATRLYVCPQRDQLFLLAVNMRDWLDDGHLAFFAVDVVAELDTSVLHRRPGGSRGRPPYEPEMMVALLLYAYCCGVRSSRRIEAACRTDAAYRVVCGGLTPDHATIARFVVDHERALEGLFVSGLRLCAAAGLADLGVVALDGTKVAADAALDRNRDGGWIRREVAKLLAATARDEQPDAAADGLPGVEAAAAVSSPAGRLARLQAALAVVQAEDAAAAEAAERQAQAAAAEAEHGRQLTGRKPTRDPLAALARAQLDHKVAVQRLDTMQAAQAAKLAAAERGETLKAPPPCLIETAKRTLARAEDALASARTATADATAARRVNITDPDSRIMNTRKGWVQGYNGQAIVNQHQIVLACHVNQDTGDVQLYQPMITALDQTLTAAGIQPDVELVLADAGYWSEANATSPGPDRLIATLKDHKQRRAARELGLTCGPPPPDASPLEQMEHLLRTPQGATAYKQRSSLIEPIFGDRKHNKGIRSFRRRGHNAAQSEWSFIHLAANMLKLHQHRAAATATA